VTIQTLFYLLFIYLIILVILKMFFAFLERPKKSKEKSAKRTKTNKQKDVKQKLINKKSALIEDKRLASQSNIVMFNPKQNFEEESSIDKYLHESKKFARMEKERIAREEFLKKANNPLKNNRTSNWSLDEYEIGEPSKANTYTNASALPQRDHPFLSSVVNDKPKYDYEKVGHLLNDIENGNTSPLPLADSFKALTRDMQIYIITKLINNSFK